MFNIPILFIIFNRPDTTSRVFKRIKEIKPKYLFIAADGPRENRDSDIELCKEARKTITDNIDWECELKTLLRDDNFGCKKAVSSAIDWFFQHVDMGIILEDDILPSPSFFQYMEQMLTFYKDDKRIMMVSGFNPFTIWNCYYSYFFAYYGSIWGWGTWKRAWNYYDVDLKKWAMIKDKDIVGRILCQNEYYVEKREKAVELAVNGTIDTWDYQWDIARLVNSGLSIIPERNLVENIGFGVDATHTQEEDPRYVNFPVYDLEFPLKHNDCCIVPDRKYDLAFSKMIFGEIVVPSASNTGIDEHYIKRVLLKARSKIDNTFLKKLIKKYFF